VRNLPIASLLSLALVAACGDSTSTAVDVDVDRILLSPATASVDVGGTVQFEASVLGSNGVPVSGQAVSWASTAPAVATVNSTGLVTAVSVGTTEISATVDSVIATSTLSVTPLPCPAPTPVSLAPGEHLTVPGSECLVLPAGSAGDLYRVAVGRPTVDAMTNSATVALAITPVGVLAVSPQSADEAPAQVRSSGTGLPGMDGSRALDRLRRMKANEAAHVALRQRELLMGLDASRVLPDRSVGPAAAPAAVEDPPSTRELYLGLTCDVSTPTPMRLIAFDANLAVYQPSSDWASSPVTPAAAQQLFDYYAAYVKDMLRAYWGNVPDTDANDRILVVTTPSLDENVAAAVFSGDYFPTTGPGSCSSSNEGEVIYFQPDVIRDLDAADPNPFALGVLAHEAKHVISVYNGLVRGSLHDLWIEEGTARVSQVMASRIAWAATGGPALGEPITREAILTAVYANSPPRETPEMTGVVDALAGTVYSLSSQPNSLLTNPSDAPEEHSFYDTSWLWHRFLGDAFGGAATALADSAFFYALSASSPADAGVSREIRVTGRGSFAQLFEDYVVATSLQGSGFTPTYAITTWDFLGAGDVFRTPNPPGSYPWPVTASETTDANGNTTSVTQWAPFTANVYSSKVGPSGVRFHDFRSSGSASAQIYVAGAADGVIVVTRLD